VLMCHPAIDQPGNEKDLIYPARVREFAVLASHELAKVLNDFNLVKSP